MKPNILIVDDEPDIRRLLQEILEDEGYSVAIAKDGESARKSIDERAPNLILLDIWMPDIDGISLLKEFFDVNHLRCPVIMMSGHGTVESAVEATRLGAFDFIEKPLSLTKILLTVESALASMTPQSNVYSTTQKLTQSVELVGKSDTIVKLKERLVQCAKHDVIALIRGELGVGKAHCARFIHTHSSRKNHNYVELRTATWMESQQEKISEYLLGTERDGVVQEGLLDQANGGTLYLNDVAELDSDSQSALFSLLTSSVFYRVGGTTPVDMDIRVILATSRDLEQEVEEQLFRKELYLSINGFPIHVQPLQAHGEDISELLQHYVTIFSDRDGLPYRSFSMAAQNRLRHYHWPGNILELENLVRRLMIQNGGASISLEEVDSILTEKVQNEHNHGLAIFEESTAFEMPLRQARELFEKAYLEYHLRQAAGSVGKVAKVAGLERTHLYRKLRALNIDTKLSTASSK
ncbi:MAG: sigma-54-dependent transcriptional regulator [Thiohalomonadales bacterium]